MTQGLEATYSLDTRTCGHGQNFWQRLMTEGKQSSKVFRPLTHPGRESLCHMGRQHAHASTPKGFEPLRAEPNGFLVHLLSHSDTVSSAGDLHWLLKHSQSTFVHQSRRLMMSETCGARAEASRPLKNRGPLGHTSPQQGTRTCEHGG